MFMLDYLSYINNVLKTVTLQLEEDVVNKP